jgi:hypothetical protein
MGRAENLGFHFVQNHPAIPLSSLPGSLGSGQSAANDIYLFFRHIHFKSKKKRTDLKYQHTKKADN